ncbi:MAG: hypothetical protein HY303_17515 [Candidatus Wallbacteria bacterium]|nr:hypothetical protein [Candidatus Wallbacteria bacterium]
MSPATRLPEVDDGLEAAELALFALRNGRSLLFWAVLGALAGWGLSHMVETKWMAEAQLTLPRGRRGLGPGLAAQAAGLAGAIDLAGDLGGGMSDRLFERILRSRTLLDRLVAKFHLAADFPKATPDSLRRMLDSRIVPETKDGLLRIGFIDSDPRRAAEICNAAVEQLQALFQELQFSQARQRRIFLEHRVDTAKQELAVAEEEFKQQQLRLGAIDPMEQGRVTLAVSRDLLTEHYRQTTELKLLEMAKQAAAPEAIVSRARLEEIDRQLQSLDRGPSARTTSPTTMPSSALLPLGAVPQVRLTLARAERQVTVLGGLYGLVKQEYERARIDEADNVERIGVLDRAVEPQVRYAPSRFTWAITCALVALMLALARAVLGTWLERIGKAEDGPGAELVAKLGRWGRWLGA